MDLPRGMKDFENDEIQKIEFIREKFLSTSNVFGFQLMEPSPIELMSVIEAKSGPTIRDDVYFFNDKGDREVSLRFDFTVGLTRYATEQKSMKLPAKFLHLVVYGDMTNLKKVDIAISINGILKSLEGKILKLIPKS